MWGRYLFKISIENHVVKWGKNIKRMKHDKRKMRVKCKADHCKWLDFSFKVEKGDESFVVKTMGLEHTCNRSYLKLLSKEVC